MVRIALAAGVLAAVLAGPAAAAFEQEPRITASLVPRAQFVADRIEAELTIVLDRRRVDPASVRVRARLDPFEELEPARRERFEADSLVRLRLRYVLACLSPACLPRAGRTPRLPAALVEYRRADGSRGARRVAWPRPLVRSRLTRIEPALRRVEGLSALLATGRGLPVISAQAQLLPLRVPPRPAPVTYRVRAAPLGAALLVAALLALAGAGALAAPLVRRSPRPPGPAPPTTFLDEALAALAETFGDGRVAERREALERLARELAAEGMPDLTATARRLAWSPEQPERPAVEALARDVRRTRREW